MFRRRFAAAMCIAVVLAVGIVFAQAQKGPVSPVTIEVAGFKSGIVSLRTAGAWPLTIDMQANSPIGIATYAAPPKYPYDTQQAFIVWVDPDGCWSHSLYGQPSAPPATRCPNFDDETYLEFTPTINLPNRVQEPDGLMQAVTLRGAPEVLGYKYPVPDDPATEEDEYQPGGNLTNFKVGPSVGDEAVGAPCGGAGTPPCDNYGYGSSPNIPGLVILSDRGVGLKWAGPDSGPTGTLRNLAGLVNSVSWVLNNCAGQRGCDSGKSIVTAHVNVPARLFTPIVRLDIGHYVDGVMSGRYYNIDGGPDWVPDNDFHLLDELRQMVTTVRIFVVSGKAPDEMKDWDGNGVIDAQDLVARGYRLLSTETVIAFRTYHQLLGANPPQSELGIPYDHDGNGMSLVIAPGGSGDITPRPR